MEIALTTGGAWRFAFLMKGGAEVEDLHRREIHRVLVSTSVHGRSLQVPRFPWCIPGTHRRPNVGESKLPPRWTSPTHGNEFQAITIPDGLRWVTGESQRAAYILPRVGAQLILPWTPKYSPPLRRIWRFGCDGFAWVCLARC